MIHKSLRKIKLIDFGSCMPLQKDNVTTFYGTQKFASPEALQHKSYKLQSQEVWALGSLLYVLLFKMDPFVSDDEILHLDIEKRIRKLMNGSRNVSPIPISEEACELIISMLDKDPARRPFVSDIKKFDFFDN